MSDSLPIVQELEYAIASDSQSMRLHALTRVSDLLLTGSGGHAEKHIAGFEDILRRLIETIELNARTQLSRPSAARLDTSRTEPRAPAFDAVATGSHPILMSGGRPTKSDPVDTTAGNRDSRVIRLVTSNPPSRSVDRVYGHPSSARPDDGFVARYMGSHRSLSREDFARLLNAASFEARTRLIAAHPRLTDAIDTIVADLSSAIGDEIRRSTRAHMRAVARIKRLHRTGQFCEADLHAYANANDFEKTAVALAALGEFPMDLTERAIIDPSAALILTLARAAQCCRTTVRAILTMPAADRGLSPADLNEALATFERLQLSTARSALEFYRLRRQGNDKAHAPTGMALQWFVQSIPQRPRRAEG